MEVTHIQQCYTSQSEETYRDLYCGLIASSETLTPSHVKAVMRLPLQSASPAIIDLFTSFLVELIKKGSHSALLCKLMMESIGRTASNVSDKDSPAITLVKQYAAIMSKLLNEDTALIKGASPVFKTCCPYRTRPFEALATYIDSLLLIGLEASCLENVLGAIFTIFLEIDGEAQTSEDPMTLKLESLIERFLLFIENACDFLDLTEFVLNCYEELLLRVHRPKVTQSVFFYFFAKDGNFGELFIKRNLQILFNRHVDNFRRKNACIFVCSFLRRAKFISGNVCLHTVRYLLEFLESGNCKEIHLEISKEILKTFVTRQFRAQPVWLKNFAEILGNFSGKFDEAELQAALRVPAFSNSSPVSSVLQRNLAAKKFPEISDSQFCPFGVKLMWICVPLLFTCEIDEPDDFEDSEIFGNFSRKFSAFDEALINGKSPAFRPLADELFTDEKFPDFSIETPSNAMNPVLSRILQSKAFKSVDSF